GGQRRHLLDQAGDFLLLLVDEGLERRDRGVEALGQVLVAGGERRDATAALGHALLGLAHAGGELLHAADELGARLGRRERLHLAVTRLHGLAAADLVNLAVHLGDERRGRD